jgi:hypothetical protein
VSMVDDKDGYLQLSIDGEGEEQDVPESYDVLSGWRAKNTEHLTKGEEDCRLEDSARLCTRKFVYQVVTSRPTPGTSSQPG